MIFFFSNRRELYYEQGSPGPGVGPGKVPTPPGPRGEAPPGSGPENVAGAKAPPGAGPENSAGAKAPPGAGQPGPQAPANFGLNVCFINCVKHEIYTQESKI